MGKIKSFLNKPQPPEEYTIENAEQYAKDLEEFANNNDSKNTPILDFLSEPLVPENATIEEAQAYAIMVQAHAKASAIKKGKLKEEHKHIHFHQ